MTASKQKSEKTEQELNNIYGRLALRKNRAFVTAGVRGIAFALITAVFSAVPFLDSLLWAVYIGFFLTMAFGADKRQLPNYICSLLAGYVWAFGYMYGYRLLEEYLNMPHIAALATAELVLTFLLIYIHIRLLSGTWLNKLPAVFAAVATVFASGGIDCIPLCAMSAATGIAIAVITEIIICAVCTSEN